MNEATEHLIQQAIDGTNTPEEQSRLDTLMAQASDVRRTVEEYRVMTGAIARIEPAAVPDGFADRVMAALPIRSAAPVRTRSWSWQHLFAPPAFRLALASVFGLVIGVAATLGTLSGTPAGTSGTMGVGEAAGRVATLFGSGVTGTAHVDSFGDGFRVALAMAAQAPISVVLEFDPAIYDVTSVMLEGAEGETITGQEPGTIRLRSGRVAVADVYIRAAGTPVPMTLQFASGDDAPTRVTLELPRE